MPFLIAQPRNGTEIRAIIIAANELGWDVYEAPSGWRLEQDLLTSGKVGVPYGSQTFCEVISQQMGWTLRFNPLDWLAKIDPKYLQRDVQFMTLAEAKKLKETKFIKPADDKVFPAAVYPPSTLDNDKQYSLLWSVHEIIPPDSPTLVSDVVTFVSEYRCFVRDQKVITCSCYLMRGEINNPRNWEKGADEVVTYLNDALADSVRSEPAVIDVGILPDGTKAIIESNQAWASGIYGCDLAGVLEVLEASCYIQEHNGKS